MNIQPVLESHRGCPNRDTWVAFNTGRLSDPEMEVLAEHVGGCGACERTLQELLRKPADSFEAKLLRFCADLSSQVRNTLSGLDAEREERVDTRTEGHGQRAKERTQTCEAQTLGPYQLLNVIGRGGMGVVYRAVHVVLDRTIALKTLHPGWERSGETFARFRREGEVVARLVHQNIVRIYDFNESEGVPYLSMELVEGETLARKLSRGALAFRDAAELVQTLSLAVEYAHTRKVVHRDLKPLNVLVSHDGTPKVTDFGLAKVLDEGWEKLTHADAVMGTPSYMAPEQAAGVMEAVGPRTDVYALGAILYESLTGTPPYLSDTKMKTLQLVQEGNLVRPSRYRDGVPPELEAICAKCLALDPSDRFSSAEALAAELGRWLDGQKTQTRPVGPCRRLLQRVGRRKSQVLTGVVAAMVAGVLVAAFPPWEPTTARETVKERAPSSEEIRTPDGKLLPFRIRYGAESTNVTADAQGAITVDAHGLCLLEYTPGPGAGPCRFRASIAHRPSKQGGVVGLYFGHRAFPSKFGEAHQFGRLVYNDFHDLGAPAKAAAGGKPIPGRPEETPGTNRVRLQVESLAPNRGQVPWSGKSEIAAGDPFALCSEDSDCFRDLEASVSADGVEGLWARRVAVSKPAHALTAEFARGLEAYRKRFDDPCPMVVGRFDPQGGIGIIIERSSAVFRGFEAVPKEPVK